MPTPLQLIDIGANLTAAAFKDDVHQVIAEAYQAGVMGMVLTGSDLADSDAAAELASQYPGQLWSTAGIHPHLAKSFDSQSIDKIRQLLTQPQVIAIGETGLDYNRNYSPAEQQLQSFEAHLQLAANTGLPMFLHQRDAHQDFMRLLSQYRDQLSRVVVHCFTGDDQELDDYLQLDCYIGITGWICDERRGHHLRDMVPRIPENRIMIETDAPYLLPRDLRPKPKSRRNVPKYLPHICEVIADCRQQSAEQLAQVSRENSEAFFGIELGCAE